MPTIDYFITGSQDAARAAVTDVLQQQGFTITPETPSKWTISRGSQAMTVLFGGLAGSKQRLVYIVQFLEHEEAVVVRFTRESGTGMMGGAIGINRSTVIFRELDQAIGTRLTEAGLLVNAVRTD
jgi:hypothetical protein